ncbi:hypothetical protein XCR_2269 [Xanthomonas campestris pv. raphani 756C]|nr:hypothetical protein XCR_2269 [Xanthomonas campestris pv. raphani 756C]
MRRQYADKWGHDILLKPAAGMARCTSCVRRWTDEPDASAQLAPHR